MFSLRLYVWVLLLSSLLGALVFLYSLVRLVGRHRREGGWILLSGALGAVLTSALYTASFVVGGGEVTDAANEVGLLWALAGFGWVGLPAAIFDRAR